MAKLGKYKNSVSQNNKQSTICQVKKQLTYSISQLVQVFFYFKN